MEESITCPNCHKGTRNITHLKQKGNLIGVGFECQFCRYEWGHGLPPEGQGVMTYSLGPGAIKCNVCGLTSYHPADVKNRYCGNCHVFHDMLVITSRPIVPYEQGGRKIVQSPRWTFVWWGIYTWKLSRGYYPRRQGYLFEFWNIGPIEIRRWAGSFYHAIEIPVNRAGENKSLGLIKEKRPDISKLLH